MPFSLGPAPAYEAEHDKKVKNEADEQCVLNDAVHFSRPDEHQRKHTLHCDHTSSLAHRTVSTCDIQLVSKTLLM